MARRVAGNEKRFQQLMLDDLTDDVDSQAVIPEPDVDRVYSLKVPLNPNQSRIKIASDFMRYRNNELRSGSG